MQRETLPRAVCFRVTRRCNARCVFCLAPPLPGDPDEAELRRRLTWLLQHGVRELRFCGGEPSLSPALGVLLQESHRAGAKTAVTTNAIELSDSLVALLSSCGTKVKVSLHGDREAHDALVAAGAFDRASAGLDRLLRRGVSTSLQSVVVRGGVPVVEWGVEFCLEKGMRRFTLIPFLPRGRGREVRDRYALEWGERSELRRAVARLRRVLGSRLDLRLLELHSCRVPVVECDGSVIWEGGTEAGDRLICTIPGCGKVPAAGGSGQ